MFESVKVFLLPKWKCASASSIHAFVVWSLFDSSLNFHLKFLHSFKEIDVSTGRISPQVTFPRHLTFSLIYYDSPLERWDKTKIWIFGLEEDWSIWSEKSPQFWRISISPTLQLVFLQLFPRILTFSTLPLTGGTTCEIKFVDLPVLPVPVNNNNFAKLPKWNNVKGEKIATEKNNSSERWKVFW